MTVKTCFRKVTAVKYVGTNADEIVSTFLPTTFFIEDGDLYFFNMNGQGRGKVPLGSVCYFENTDPRVDSEEVFNQQFQEVQP